VLYAPFDVKLSLFPGLQIPLREVFRGR